MRKETFKREHVNTSSLYNITQLCIVMVIRGASSLLLNGMDTCESRFHLYLGVNDMTFMKVLLT